MAGRCTFGRLAVALGDLLSWSAAQFHGEARAKAALPAASPLPAWHQESCQAGGMGREESNSLERLVSRPI
jgi:hypothetical protein